jgi:hypothetical protein
MSSNFVVVPPAGVNESPPSAARLDDIKILARSVNFEAARKRHDNNFAAAHTSGFV